MLNSRRSKTNTVAKLAAAFAISLVAVSTTPSAFAQQSHQYAPGATRHVKQSRDTAPSARGGREAYGMASEYGFSDPNSPAATGGGSLGYNRNLMQY